MEDRETLRSLIEQPVRQVDDEAGVPTPAEVAASWQVMGQRLSGKGSTRLNGIRIFGTQPLRQRVWYVVAGCALTVLGVVVGWSGRARTFSGRESSSVLAYTTTNGERANITLMDSTTVVLDVASRLEVPADYPAGNHTLRLTGEALFTVIHHEGTPFTVLTGLARTQVLGTSFIVRHYASDTTTMVAVRDGKVTVRSTRTPSTVVTAAQQAEIAQTGQIQTRSADLAQFAFATGLLKLDRVPLPAAIPELNRWYDVDIRLGAPSLASERVTGEFAVGSLADLSDILSLMFNVRVVRDGRVLTLYPR
ncbi:MAG TPA: FecR domain-containing protein [Gemmatimonadaceae bacterium]|jgi:ferric-dicitrate binding protein FerR (iron transport regulator)|nr:FecR domain-containing protein [Gemmatimonadaceae bacterium]